ncbi:hypothetical protein Tco_0836940 [Tanacetum coccineum]
MSQPANDEFSQHLGDDEDIKPMKDASDYGDSPIQQQQVIQTWKSKEENFYWNDGVNSNTSTVKAAEIQAIEKERKAKIIWFGLEAHGAEVSTKDANHKFLRSLPPTWSNLAMTMRTKPDVDTLSIDDLYNNLRVFEQEIQGALKTSSSAQNVAFVSQSKSSTNKVKSGVYFIIPFCQTIRFAKQSEDWDLLHEDLEQIDDVDIEEMDINWQIE